MFLRKFDVFTKILYFYENLMFLRKFDIFTKIWYFTKIWCFYENV